MGGRERALPSLSCLPPSQVLVSVTDRFHVLSLNATDLFTINWWVSFHYYVSTYTLTYTHTHMFIYVCARLSNDYRETIIRCEKEEKLKGESGKRVEREERERNLFRKRVLSVIDSNLSIKLASTMNEKAIALLKRKGINVDVLTADEVRVCVCVCVCVSVCVCVCVCVYVCV